MRMIPHQVSSSTQSDAEKALFRRLRLVDDSDWSLALHSLNLAEHVWKRVGEIDFLLVGSRGIYVLEVKGGHVSRSQGVWRFTHRVGPVPRTRGGAFRPAPTAMVSPPQKTLAAGPPRHLAR